MIEIDLQNLSHQPVIEFCLTQTELRSVNYIFLGDDELFINSLLLILLNNCPHLRNLEVTCNSIIRLNDLLFQRLSVSELKSLSIKSSRVLLPSSLSTEHVELLTNDHLRSLSLGPNLGGCSLLTVFRNLRYLELSCPSNKLLQSVWKLQVSTNLLSDVDIYVSIVIDVGIFYVFQPNLVALKLLGVNRCSTVGFCGKPEDVSSCSIRNLRSMF